MGGLESLRLAFLNSWRGLRHAARTERAVRQELVLLVLGVPAALLLSPSLRVRAALVAALLVMLAVELLNTAIEKLCDHVCPSVDPSIGIVKDLASAGAFLSQCVAALVWVVALAERLG